MSLINIISTLVKNPYNPIGLPQQEGLFDTSRWSLIEKIDTFNRQTKTFFDGVGKVWDYVSHPIKIWVGFVDISYWVLLGACICLFLMYVITNDKKDLQNVLKVFCIHFIIRLINLCIA